MGCQTSDGNQRLRPSTNVPSPIHSARSADGRSPRERAFAVNRRPAVKFFGNANQPSPRPCVCTGVGGSRQGRSAGRKAAGPLHGGSGPRHSRVSRQSRRRRRRGLGSGARTRGCRLRRLAHATPKAASSAGPQDASVSSIGMPPTCARVIGRSPWCSRRPGAAPRGRARVRRGARGGRRRSWGRAPSRRRVCS